MTTYAHDDLQRVLAAHAKWLRGEKGARAYLSDADLSGADLSSADLSSAYLSDADLSGADLSGADLSGANLSGADLSGADLSGANLSGADLSGADLSGANLRDANLRDANLSSAYLSDDVVLSDGLSFKTYRDELVPALLVAGGRTLVEVATPEHWDCHSWNGDTVGCPMAVAFGARSLSDIPVLYRAQAERFIQMFDARLIPLPVVLADA